jgi:transposase-like protein
VKLLRPTHPYIKVNGRWCYLYRAIDRFGALVDVRLSETRDMEAAKAFFRSAKAVTGVTPARVTTDGHDSYPRAIRTELNESVKHRTSQYLTDVVDKTFFADWCYFLPARVTAWRKVSIGMRARYAA